MAAVSSLIPDSATLTTPSGIRGTIRAARPGSTSKVIRSRWLTPTRDAPTAKARSNSVSSWTSTRVSIPSSADSAWKSAISRSSRAATISNTASAPMMRASHTSRASTVKSFRRTGRSTANRAARRSPAEPPKNDSSVSTDRHAAPPVAYWTATTAGSRPVSRSPRDGERLLTSAITAISSGVPPTNAWMNPRGSSPLRAESRRSSSERPSRLAVSRWAARIRSR